MTSDLEQERAFLRYQLLRLERDHKRTVEPIRARLGEIAMQLHPGIPEMPMNPVHAARHHRFIQGDIDANAD